MSSPLFGVCICFCVLQTNPFPNLQMFELLFVTSAKPVVTKLEEAPLTVGASLAPQVTYSHAWSKYRSTNLLRYAGLRSFRWELRQWIQAVTWCLF